MRASRAISSVVEGQSLSIRHEGMASVFLILLLTLISLLLSISLLTTIGLGSASVGSEPSHVLAVRLDGEITPSSDDLVRAALAEADAGDYQALMIILNTPGGGLTETLDIIGQMENTSLPVIGYVYPEGATAWSAGAIILLSSDVAAMAPHAIIGSAQPVQLSPLGETVPVNDTKTINAIVALIEERARAHGRNATAARAFVIENLNLNADEAKRFGVIEYVSPDAQSLIAQLNGLKVKNTTLQTASSEVTYFEPPLGLSLLMTLSDPMLAGLLLLVGLYALIFGLSSPGMGAEVFGLIALALGLIGLGFNVNLAALFLVLLGMGLILLELHSHSFGLLAAAGLACIIVGSILLVPTSYPEYYLPGEYQRSLAEAFIVPSLIMGGFLAFAVYKVARIRLARPSTGRIIGEEAEALERISPRGYVQFQGEYWLAESNETVEKGERVVIVGKEGARLKVSRK